MLDEQHNPQDARSWCLGVRSRKLRGMNEPNKRTRATLIIGGLVATGVGAAILADPVAFYSSNGIQLEMNASLLSEVRASAGALLALGGLIGAGAFWRRLTLPSLLVSAVLYTAYGLARLVGFGLDGLPSDSLVYSTLIELVLGVVSAVALQQQLGTPARGPSLPVAPVTSR